jgi:hypothetical protein
MKKNKYNVRKSQLALQHHVFQADKQSTLPSTPVSVLSQRFHALRCIAAELETDWRLIHGNWASHGR